MGVLVANLAQFRRTETSVSTKLDESIFAAAKAIKTSAIGHFQGTLLLNETLLAQKRSLDTARRIVLGEIWRATTITEVTLTTYDARFAVSVSVARISQYSGSRRWRR